MPHKCSLTLLNRTGGENVMTKLVGQHKDREVIYLLSSWGKNIQFEGKIFIFCKLK